MNTPIIAQPPAHGTTSAPLILRYHQIKVITLHTGTKLAFADGVVEVEGVAWLGQVQWDRDTNTFQVAAFVDATGHGWQAPLGWQADILLSMQDGGGDDPPPTPAALAPVRFDLYLARRRALVLAPTASPAWLAALAAPGGPLAAPHCPRCTFVCAFSATTVRCLHPRCTWERAVQAADRRRLVADVCGEAA